MYYPNLYLSSVWNVIFCQICVPNCLLLSVSLWGARKTIFLKKKRNKHLIKVNVLASFGFSLSLFSVHNVQFRPQICFVFVFVFSKRKSVVTFYFGADLHVMSSFNTRYTRFFRILGCSVAFLLCHTWFLFSDLPVVCSMGIFVNTLWTAYSGGKVATAPKLVFCFSVLGIVFS